MRAASANRPVLVVLVIVTMVAVVASIPSAQQNLWLAYAPASWTPAARMRQLGSLRAP
jgi:hypothetical protein